MERGEAALVLIAIYFVVGALVALVARKKYSGDLAEFYAAPRRFGWFLSSLTYAATTYSAFMIIGLVGLAYSTGVGALGFELSYLASTVIMLGLFSLGVWRTSSERGWLTPSQMIGDMYGSRSLSLIVSILYLAALSPYMAAQIQGIASALSSVGLGFSKGVAIAFVAALLWTLSAGMRSIVYTDAFQGLWMIAASLLLLAWLVGKTGMTIGIGQGIALLGEKGFLSVGQGFWTLNVYLGFTLPWIFFSVTNPQVIHRLYLPKRKRDVKLMLVSFTVYGLAYTVIMVLIGLLARALSLSGLLPVVSERDMVTPTLLSLASPVLSAFVLTSVLAASISTVDSILHSVSSSVSKSLSDQTVIPGIYERVMAYLITIVLLFSVSILSLYRLAFIVELSVISSLLLLPLAPLTIYGWASPSRNTRRLSGMASLASGLLVELAGLAYAAARGLPLKSLLLFTPVGMPFSVWLILIPTIVLLVFDRYG